MKFEHDYSALFAEANEKADKLKDSTDNAIKERYVEAKMCLDELKMLHNYRPEAPIWEVAQCFYEEAIDFLISQQNKKLKAAEQFCVMQHLSKEESDEHMNGVKQQLLAETTTFRNNQNYLFELLGLYLDGDTVKQL